MKARTGVASEFEVVGRQTDGGCSLWRDGAPAHDKRQRRQQMSRGMELCGAVRVQAVVRLWVGCWVVAAARLRKLLPEILPRDKQSAASVRRAGGAAG